MCIASLAATFALAPEANADRRSSLSGNLLLEDTDDVFFFPHRALDNVHLITFDLALGGVATPNELPTAGGTTSGFGSAGILLGDESLALGAFTHRSDTLSSLPAAYYLGGDIDTLYGNQAAFQIWPLTNFALPAVAGGNLVNGATASVPLQWLDLVATMNSGGTPLGLRLSVGLNLNNSNYDDDGDITFHDNTAFAVNAIAGMGLRGDLNLDLSAELSFGSQSFTEDIDGDPVNTFGSTGFSLAAMARGFSNMGKGVDMGFTGLLYFQSSSGFIDFSDVNGPDDGFDANSFGLDVGAGPKYYVEDHFNIAAYGTLGVRREFVEPSTEGEADERTDFSVVVPGFKLAAEYYMFNWLWFRTGAQYHYRLVFRTAPTGDNNIFHDQTFTQSGFRWASGVGIEWEQLRINGTFNTPFLLDGPNFIGGGTGMFGMIQTEYNF